MAIREKKRNMSMADPIHDWQGLTEVIEAKNTAAQDLRYQLSYADALNILRFVDHAPNVRELRITLNGFQIEVMRDAGDRPAPAHNGASVAAVAASPPAAPKPVAPPSPAAAPAPQNAAPAVDAVAGAAAVRSPIVGVFYRAPSPGAPPFVERGSPVEEETVVGIIEVMKVMNSIKAGVKGVVAEICVENEELVQFDQTLLYVAPGDQASS
jgi:acetyl-CoA carboxylase biotin carboxyl carrier protein